MRGASEGEANLRTADQIEHPDVCLSISHRYRQLLAIGRKQSATFIGRLLGNLAQRLAAAIDPVKTGSGRFRSGLVNQKTVLTRSECGVPCSGIVFREVGDGDRVS